INCTELNIQLFANSIPQVKKREGFRTVFEGIPNGLLANADSPLIEEIVVCFFALISIFPLLQKHPT
ncbi:MAG: hypothetical protein KTR29_09105, partial [Rhodothermaceae bacterium]|nr:hypothetical protein [Rhodothermaceae bacterium]